MKHLIHIVSLITGISFSLSAAPMGPAAADQSFKLTDEEIKMMNLSESEAAELRQFFDALNTLTPTQKKELEDLGRQTEEKMRQKNLDPSNFEDLVKFMEEEQGQPAQKQQAKPEPRESRFPEPRFNEPRFGEQPRLPAEKQKAAPIVSPKDTLAMLESISKHIASLRQKAVTRITLQKKLTNIRQELNELVRFIDILKAPDLINLLTSSEFMRLHSNLEAFHKALTTYEPSIIARKARTLDEATPYEILQISEGATDDEIAAAYQALEETKNPKAIEAVLKEEGLDPQVLKKRLKDAKRSFALITQAYESLKDPEQRTILDAELSERRALEERNERSSLRAFDRLFNALSTAIYSDGIVRAIQQLLEKYKPQELAAAKAQLELEKKAYERSKQVVRVPQAPPRFGGHETGYEPFYQKMMQESYQRPYYQGGRPNGFGQFGQPQQGPQGGPQTGQGVTPEKPGGKKNATGTPEDKNKDDKNKNETEAPDKATRKKEQDAQKALRKEAGLLTQLNDLLAKAQAIEGQLQNGEEEEEESEKSEQVLRGPAGPKPPAIKTLMTHISHDLSQNPHRGQPAAAEEPQKMGNERILEQLFNEGIQIASIAEKLKQFAPEKNKLLSTDAKKEWKKNVSDKYEPMVKGWYDSVYKTLKDLSTSPKAKDYNLAGADPDPLQELKKPGEPAEGKANLGQLRHSINAVYEYFKKLDAASAPATVPALQKHSL